jgi:hypothetical protein
MPEAFRGYRPSPPALGRNHCIFSEESAVISNIWFGRHFLPSLGNSCPIISLASKILFQFASQTKNGLRVQLGNA